MSRRGAAILRALGYRAATRGHAIVKPQVRTAQALLRARMGASVEDAFAVRDRAFVELIQHAYHHVPYYRHTMDARGLTPASFRGLRDLTKLPILTKDIIRREGHALRSDRHPDAQCTVRRSGGTTGEPIASYVSGVAHALETASFYRGLEWMGWHPGLSMVLLFGGSLGQAKVVTLKDRMKRLVTGTVFLPAFELSTSNADRYFHAIREAGPCVLIGYASALASLATCAEKIGAGTLPLTHIFSTAETLPDDWAERIRRNLGAPVTSYYGCGELNSIAFQTEPGGPYYVADEHVHVESLGPTDPSDLAECIEVEGSLLVTSLYNYAQPLIRYALGDLGDIAEPGVVHPTRTVIRRLHGRVADMFVRTDGTRVSASLGPHAIFVTKLAVRKYQFIQWEPGRIEFRYDPEDDAAGLVEGIERIAEILRSHLGPDLFVEARPSRTFILSKAGKHRIVIPPESAAASRVDTPDGHDLASRSK